MKTPRRKYYNSHRDASDVYIRELGPLEIGELETPKERRSAPVAAVRYLAGSKFQSNSVDGSEYSENSDYTDARSENTEDLVDSYKSDRQYQAKRPSRSYSELKSESQDHDYSRNRTPVRNNFAREFKLKYGSNLTSNLHYYHASKATHDTLFHNMDYIHSQFTNLNPSFINFNYGHFSYPNLSTLNNRAGEYYNSSQRTTYASNYHRPMPEYGCQRPESMPPINHDYYNRIDPYYNRYPQTYEDVPQSYVRLPENNRSTGVVCMGFTPSSNNRRQDYNQQQYHCNKHNCNGNHYDSAYEVREEVHERNKLSDRQDNGHNYKHERRERNIGEEQAHSYLNRKDEEVIKQAIEKAVKNAFESYISTSNLKKGDETCFAEPVSSMFTHENNDETLRNHQQEQMYANSNYKHYKEQFSEYSKKCQYSKEQLNPEEFVSRNHEVYISKDQPYNSDNQIHVGKIQPYNSNYHCYSRTDNGYEINAKKDGVYQTVGTSDYTTNCYKEQDGHLSSECIAKEISSFDITKLRAEIQKVIDDVDMLTNYGSNESAVNQYVARPEEKLDMYGRNPGDHPINQLYSSQLTDYNRFESNKYDHVDMFMTKSTTVYELASKGMSSSQSLEETYQYAPEEDYERNELFREKMVESDSKGQRLSHVDLFNNDEVSNTDNYMEERSTNRDEDNQSALMGGSSYEMELNLGSTSYNNGNKYPDTSYYSSSSFNLNTFNSFSCLRSSGSKDDINQNEEEVENYNGATLSTSDLIESRNNVQSYNDDYDRENGEYNRSNAADANDCDARNNNIDDDGLNDNDDGHSNGNYDNNKNYSDKNDYKTEDGDKNYNSDNGNDGGLVNDESNNSKTNTKYDNVNCNKNNSTNNPKSHNKHECGNLSSTPELQSQKVDGTVDNPFLNKKTPKPANGIIGKFESGSELFKSENSESILYKRGGSDEKSKESYAQNQQNKSGNAEDLRGSYTGQRYKNQTQNLKSTSQNNKIHNTNDDLSNSSLKRSHPPNIDGVSHICSRIEHLEESLRRIESHLTSEVQEKDGSLKGMESKRGNAQVKSPSTNTQLDRVSEVELMEGYKAASIIKKLLHVKSMDSLIPAFTAFVQNRMA